jgi:hypothetical protein
MKGERERKREREESAASAIDYYAYLLMALQSV